MTISIEEMLGIDRTDPMQQRARKQVRADWDLIRKLVAAREGAGMTQTEVAELMGVSQSAVARIESGARDPHLSTLRRYAVAVGTNVKYVVERPTAEQTAHSYVSRAVSDDVEENLDWSGSYAELAKAVDGYAHGKR